MAWNSSLPISSTKVKDVDDIYRANWAALVDAIGREHNDIDAVSNPTYEKPSRCRVVAITDLATINTLSNVIGGIAFATDIWDWYINDGAIWNRCRQIELSASAFFYQTTAPAGWVIRTDAAFSDKILVIKDASGGSTGGSWTITGIGESGTHTHIYTEVPSHRHQFRSNANWGTNSPDYTIRTDTYKNNNIVTSYTGNASCTTSTGIANGSSADGAWRPKGNVFIVCQKA